MYGENKNKSGSKNFPNPLASAEEKESKKYSDEEKISALDFFPDSEVPDYDNMTFRVTHPLP
mgnify:CR=1 FL=1